MPVPDIAALLIMHVPRAPILDNSMPVNLNLGTRKPQNPSTGSGSPQLVFAQSASACRTVTAAFNARLGGAAFSCDGVGQSGHRAFPEGLALWQDTPPTIHPQ